MYLETGLGQHSRRQRKKRFISAPRVGPADQLLIAEMKWGLKVPFRKDFGAFRQEMAKAIGRHVIKNASDITKADDWILKRPVNEQRLKTIHTDLLKLAKKEGVSVFVRTRYTFLQGVDTVVSTVEIVGSKY